MESSDRPLAADDGRGNLSSFMTERPVAITMVFVAALVFGYFSYGRLSVTLMPRLSYPTLTVRTEYPGAAPEEVESDVSRPVEEALGVVAGLRKASSISRAGVSDVVLEFSWDTSMSEAIQDSLEKLDLILLPEEAERPLILRFDPSLDPVMELSLAGSGDRFGGEEGLRRLRRIAELQLKRELEPIKGVAAVRVRGGLEEEIHVLLDETELQRTGLSIRSVIDRLAQENINLAGGTLTEGRTEYMVRTLNEYEDLAEISDTIIARFEGRDVRLGSIGRVVRAHKEREILTRTNGHEGVQIDVFKEADANIVALAKRVKTALGEFDFEEARQELLAAASGSKDQQPEEAKDGQRARRKKKRRGPPGLIEKTWRNEGAELSLVADRSLFIESSIREVRNTALLGGLLAITILFLFLKDVRTTSIIAISIPISLLVTFAPLHLLGVSLNIMSLGGLALGIGMLVDSSIVVLESIFRCREEGDPLEAAAVRGTTEVRGPVIASTLTTIAVFFPMVFVEGVAGQAFGDLGLAVVISLLAALVVALFLIPMLASRQGMRLTGGRDQPIEWKTFASWRGLTADAKSTLSRAKQRSGLRKALGYTALPVVMLYLGLRFVVGVVLEIIGKLLLGFLFGALWLGRKFVVPAMGKLFGLMAAVPLRLTQGSLDGLHERYPHTLRWALRSPLTVVVVVLLCFAATAWTALSLDTELLPEVHQGEFTVEVGLPVGTPIEATEAIVAPVEQAILEEKEHIESLMLTVGFDPAYSNRSDEGEHTARFKVLLDRANPTLERKVIDRLRKRFSGIPDLDARVTRPVLFSFKTPIEVEVHGNDLVELRRQADLVKRTMSAMPELADVETTSRRGAPEVQVVYDRDLLARYDLAPGQVARRVRDKVQGFEATRFNLKDRRIPIVVRLEDTDRESVADVSALIINPGGARPIPLSAVGVVELAEGPSEVRRVDGRRISLVTASIAKGSLGSAVEAIEANLDRLVWPSGTTYLMAGQNDEWERSKGSLWLAMALSIFLVYVIMAAQFESLFHPLVILFTIPLAFFGTVVCLYALGISLSIVVFLGMIMLAGIVVNNAIVLVDYINLLRRRGMDATEAVVTAGSVRLRPILMTTATTALGLLPMALGLGNGAELRTPMAITVISGLLVSTFLTLLVIPVIYSLLDQLRARLTGQETLPDTVSPASPASPDTLSTIGTV
ncbi:MAG: efflux RND transporter permease subunit [Acidobacteriota bacterium]|nr:efflux RND transporter permease subunit [Acidobacteriota bacterium]